MTASTEVFLTAHYQIIIERSSARHKAKPGVACGCKSFRIDALDMTNRTGHPCMIRHPNASIITVVKHGPLARHATKAEKPV